MQILSSFVGMHNFLYGMQHFHVEPLLFHWISYSKATTKVQKYSSCNKSPNEALSRQSKVRVIQHATQCHVEYRVGLAKATCFE